MESLLSSHLSKDCEAGAHPPTTYLKRFANPETLSQVSPTTSKDSGQISFNEFIQRVY